MASSTTSSRKSLLLANATFFVLSGKETEDLSSQGTLRIGGFELHANDIVSIAAYGGEPGHEADADAAQDLMIMTWNRMRPKQGEAEDGSTESTEALVQRRVGPSMASVKTESPDSETRQAASSDVGSAPSSDGNQGGSPTNPAPSAAYWASASADDKVLMEKLREHLEKGHGPVFPRDAQSLLIGFKEVHSMSAEVQQGRDAKDTEVVLKEGSPPSGVVRTGTGMSDAVYVGPEMGDYGVITVDSGSESDDSQSG